MYGIKTTIKDVIKKQIEKTLDNFLKFQSFRDYIHHRSKREIVSKKIYKYVGTDDAMFYNDDMVSTVEQVNNEYSFEDLRPTDIVLDIGACIGAFSLKVCKKVSHVFAVEPIMAERLKQNIALNSVNNISVLEYALGNGDLELNWSGKTRRIKGTMLSEIIKLCGGHVDFLKCDCEGGEWSISPDELKGIRRIEAEIHSFKGMPKLETFDAVLKSAGFEYEKEILSEEAMIIHARNKYGVSKSNS